MAAPKVKIITLGCSKNLVDSQRVAALLREAGYEAVPEDYSRRTAATVINTCGFIGDAKEESINTVLETCAARDAGRTGRVYVMGCLSQRYRDELPGEIPEVDRWFGKFDWTGIAGALKADGVQGGVPVKAPSKAAHHAYVKIAEGCDRFCAFCAIPLITGRFHSRRPDDILAEVSAKAASGVKEFNIIAQDLSAYGRDLNPGRRSGLADLIARMAALPGVERIRLHYAYPADFPYDVLPVMASHPNVCRYLDIALQHIDDGVLTAMRRHITAAETRQLLDRLRREVPGIHIRTTLMVGFPGETEEAFGRLLDFVREQRFERMGAFAYCEEDDTYAARHLPDDIPAEVKQERLDRLMALQQEIALECNAAKTGTVLPVIIDREEEEFYVGRSEFDSPEVDPEVLVRKTAELKPGDMCRVRIEQALPFELIGTIES